MAVEFWIGTGLVLTLVIVSGLIVWSGVRQYRQGTAIDRTHPMQESAASDGLVSVEGTISGPADGRALESHLGGTPCVAYSYEVIQEKSATPGEDVNRSSRIRFDKDRGKNAIPFTVDTDGGRIHVDASDAHIDWANMEFERVSEGQVVRNRSGLRAVLGLLRMLGRSADRRRRYLEACLRPGDRVHVIGTPRANGEGTDVTLAKTRGSPLVVSPNAPESVAGWFRNRAKQRLTWAALVLGAGVFFAYLTIDIM